MAEYIDREKLLEHIKDVPTWWADEGGVYPGSHRYPDGMFDPADVVGSIENAPAADVVPVVHGRWVCKDNQLFPPYCSACLTDSHRKGYTPYYCPFCGAKMDLEDGQ